MPFLFTYRGERAMSGIDDRIVRQGKQFVLDTLHQLPSTSARRVRTANALLKQYVAVKSSPGGWLVKGDVARRVARRVQNVQPQRAQLDDLALGQRHGRLRAGLDKHAKQRHAAVRAQQRQIARRALVYPTLSPR